MLTSNHYHRQVLRWLQEWGFQYMEEYPVPGSPYRLDVWLPELGVGLEVDGPQHRLQGKRDKQRDARLLGEGIRVVRVPVGAAKPEVWRRIEKATGLAAGREKL